MDVFGGRIVLDITTSLSSLYSTASNYTRVERTLFEELHDSDGCTVAFTKDGAACVSTQMPSPRAYDEQWAIENYPTRRPNFEECRRIPDLVFQYARSFLEGAPIKRRTAHTLAWKLAHMYEGLPIFVRRMLIRRTKLMHDPALRNYFFSWLAERGVDPHWHPLGDFFESRSKFSFQRGDILVLAGASWCHVDFRSLQRSKDATGLKVIAFIYDLLPIQYPSLVTVDERRRYRQFISGVVSTADLVVTPSASVASQLMTYATREGLAIAAPVAPISLSKSSLPNAEGMQSARVRRTLPKDKPFVLCASPLRKRKHVLWLYSLWTELWKSDANTPVLVVAGHVLEPDVLQFLEADPLWNTAAKLLRDPSDSELQWLYARALFCLQPSFEGGLGASVMQAVNFGKPCIAADAPSLVEAGQARAMYLPFDRASWITAIRALIETKTDHPVRRLAAPESTRRRLIDEILDRFMQVAASDQ